MPNPPAPPSILPTVPATILVRANLHRFPNSVRLEARTPFYKWWQAKEQDYLEFTNLWKQANNCLYNRLGWWLPDELLEDWEATWQTDFNRIDFQSYFTNAPERILEAVVDVVTLLRAVRFVIDHHAWDGAERFWAYKLPNQTGLPCFPTVAEIQLQNPELDPRRGCEDSMGDCSRFGQFCQRQFFDRAAFLLNTPTEEDWLWLSQLAYRPDPKQQVLEAYGYLKHCLDVFSETIPILSVALNIRYDAWIADTSIPITVIFGIAHNWCLDAREAIGWKVGEPAPEEATSTINAEQGDWPGDSSEPNEKDLPDGPLDPPGFRWKNVVYPFTTSELRYHRLLSATWSLFRVRQKGYVSQVIDDYDRNGGAHIERRALQNYARDLSNIILPRFPGFPARLVVSGTAVYWEDLPCVA